MVPPPAPGRQPDRLRRSLGVRRGRPASPRWGERNAGLRPPAVEWELTNNNGVVGDGREELTLHARKRAGDDVRHRQLWTHWIRLVYDDPTIWVPRAVPEDQVLLRI